MARPLTPYMHYIIEVELASNSVLSQCKVHNSPVWSSRPPFAMQLDEGTLEEPEIAYILQQVLRALAYVHAQQRVHRDVKAANVLLSVAGAVKISDFGVSGQMTGASLLSRVVQKSPCHSPPPLDAGLHVPAS